MPAYRFSGPETATDRDDTRSWARHLHFSTQGWTRMHWIIAVGVTVLLWFVFGWAFGLLFGAVAGIATFLGWVAGVVLAGALVVAAFFLMVLVATRMIVDFFS
ncbi:hypothetical protein CCR85_07080 [Rhodothalassium salexigens]|uniref:Uncharacterized protein n=1 Tax=Rhodothalassium salexigens DSM 2132 TaxID=1188247 RepID=A0A4R2PKR5_RHOSA|nr:hypothetical protein [Rhodothalassium salexigens]MBB4211464.1 hypothetical protein [Rhodothalassium salexigens DSM 2132]MBK1639401.1 hypothetical protein [Rhodothalassium salexigens DSM 2132]MBK5911254.1 hypothetical protein [Rhodothalassium salexigens]MBK5920665.1 hypothetical protein [Rhodothalassium salexigens]TCP35384.1 hypothetical protein EV659_104236 [Rhodothalassium salexigens DSM 2132]